MRVADSVSSFLSSDILFDNPLREGGIRFNVQRPTPPPPGLE